jgi:hypothetical protein
MRRLIELITGEPLAPHERPARMILTAVIGAVAVYVILALLLSL